MTYLPLDESVPPVSFMELIRYVMIFPDIAENDLTAVFRKQAASTLRALAAEGKEETLLPLVKDDDSQILAMMRVVSDVPVKQEEMLKRWNEGLLSGLILWNIIRLDHFGLDGSVAKSIYYIQNTAGVSRSKLARAWSKYKNVSNYYVAMQVLIKTGIYDPVERLENAKSLGIDEGLAFYAINAMFFQAFINIAMHIGKIACERVDKWTKRPLVELRNTWTVKKEFIERAREHCRAIGFREDQILQINHVPPIPFTQKDLDILSGYSAGQH